MTTRELFLFISVILASIGMKAQEFTDTIVTTNADTILCEITLVNNYNIFYTYNPKKKKIVDTFIGRSKVESFSVQDGSVEIQEEEAPPERVNSNFTESNGLIYPAALSSPPVFGQGQNDLYNHLIENVRVYSRDARVFGANAGISLFEIRIDTTGKVTEAGVSESAVQTVGLHYDCRYLENEIKSVLSTSSNWTPAKVDGEKVESKVYVPLKYRPDGNSIFIYPSKYLFTFKDRE